MAHAFSMIHADAVIAHCRAGFEDECAADIEHIAAGAGVSLSIDAQSDRAFVTAAARIDAIRWTEALANVPPMFARSVFTGSGPHALSSRDRITPIVELAAGLGPPYQCVWLETPDTNQGKMRSGMCRRLAPLLDSAMETAGMLARGVARLPRLHVLFEDDQNAWIGVSHAPTGSAWPMGIPRLAMPRGAPSRSTLKLAEALMTFLDDDERLRWLRPAMRAVDLGAAPGGWTWQLVQRGLRVVAVDNGPLKGAVASDPLVEHLRVDGLSYRPRRAVDWMVCDMVLQPSRIAALVAAWVADGACRRTIFNLKLPMKKRYDEVRHCESTIRDALEQRRTRYRLRFKQLYHDREEITGYCSRVE
jgi:23S rRNA (cytidine2498-2'-O)-methyltransferase